MNGVTFTKMENTPGIAFEMEPIEFNCGLADHEVPVDIGSWM